MDYRPHNRIRHGAALIYVLAIVTIVAVLALGVVNLVVAHYQTEAQLRGYARAYYIAESAANWQLNRMSRLDPNAPPNGKSSIPGRLSWSQVVGLPTGFFPLYDDNTVPLPGFPGTASITLAGLTGNNSSRNPPSQFQLTVLGKDTETGIVRGLTFVGAATGLADRYCLYGQNGIFFTSATNGGTTLGSSSMTGNPNSVLYIGTNGELTGTSPTVPAGYVFGGCRLGPAGTVSFQNSLSGWDIVSLPTPVCWPTVAEIEKTVWQGSLSTNANNTQITYRQADGSYVPFAKPVTELTNTEFAQSTYLDANKNPQRTIKLSSAAPMQANGYNLFHFNNIQMGPSDVLILDLEDIGNPVTTHTAIRIVIDNATQPIQLTNLAYYQGGTATNPNPQSPSYLWFNNSNQLISYTPMLPMTQIDPTNFYTIQPILHGLVYGINQNMAQDNKAGYIFIDGSAQPVTVDTLIGNYLTLKGNVTTSSAQVENPSDANRYVLYYRIYQQLGEYNNGSGPVPHESVIGYGQFP